MRTCTHIKIPLSSSYEYFEVHNNFNTLLTVFLLSGTSAASSQDSTLKVIHKHIRASIFKLKEAIIGSIPAKFRGIQVN